MIFEVQVYLVQCLRDPKWKVPRSSTEGKQPTEKGKGRCIKRWEVKDLCSCLMCWCEAVKGKIIQKTITMRSTVISVVFLYVSKSDFTISVITIVHFPFTLKNQVNWDMWMWFRCLHVYTGSLRKAECVFVSLQLSTRNLGKKMFTSSKVARGKVSKQAFLWLRKDYNQNCLLKGHHPIYKPLSSKQCAIDPSFLEH